MTLFSSKNFNFFLFPVNKKEKNEEIFFFLQLTIILKPPRKNTITIIQQPNMNKHTHTHSL